MPIRHKIKRAVFEAGGSSLSRHQMHLIANGSTSGQRLPKLSSPQCVEITLRPYAPRDLNAMTILDSLCFGKDFLFGETMMEVLAESAYAFTLVADDPSGDLAGFAIAHRRQEENPEAAYLVTIDVDPRLRRCGIASGLLRAIERLLVDSEVYCLELHVHTGNLGAIRFYEEHGFTSKGRIPNFYGAVDRDAFLYAKTLGAAMTVPLRPRV